MTAQSQFFALAGGLDQETPALAMPPGRVIACLNHEAVSRGYGRTEGFERFDGQRSPTSSTFYTLTFTDGERAITPGMLLHGYTAGGTFRVLAAPIITSGSWAGGDAAGLLPVHLVAGDFEIGELIRDASYTYAVLATIPIEGDFLAGDQEDAWYDLAQEYDRQLITPVPGMGPVRGVLWYNGRINAWRDSGDGTSARLYYSSSAGWVAPNLGRNVAFTNGGPYELKAGDIIVGDETGAHATIRTIALDSDGDWADSDASGTLVLDNVVGTLEDETISVGANTHIAHIAAAPQVVTFPAGGRYEFDIFNFYGSVGYERAYGANGVGPAFEFDGNSIIPISTGMPDDRPFLVKEHKNHLFLAFPKGSLQHSELGEPRSFNARFGAAELGMGHEITSLIPNTSNAMLVTTETSIAALTGNDSSDWQLERLNTSEAGAKRHTAARIGKVVYLDNRGLRSAEATSAYGNFRIGTYTAAISAELEAKRQAGHYPVAACVVKSKDQYLLFFDDGTGISVYFGRKNPEPMLFEYPFVVSCLHIAEVDGIERLFVGATDGFVYELNRGTSFDGASIAGFIALPFGHQGDPRSLKRYQKAAIEVVGGPRSTISYLAQFDYGNDYQPFTQATEVVSQGGGGLWGLVQWGGFVWGAPAISRTEVFLQGVGANMGLIIKSDSAKMESYVLQGITLMFSPRGRMR